MTTLLGRRFKGQIVRVPASARSIPKSAPAGTRKLSSPWQCGLCDMSRATKHKIRGCKRPAWFSVPDTAYGRMPVCLYHQRKFTA